MDLIRGISPILYQYAHDSISYVRPRSNNALVLRNLSSPHNRALDNELTT